MRRAPSRQTDGSPPATSSRSTASGSRRCAAKATGSSFPMSYRLVPFGSGEPGPVCDLARLHTALLPTSPVSLLGSRFMERFYYRVLPRQGLIVGAVAYVGDRAVGFIAATHDSAGFMRSALRRSWMSFGWILGTSVVLAPKSI